MAAYVKVTVQQFTGCWYNTHKPHIIVTGSGIGRTAKLAHKRAMQAVYAQYELGYCPLADQIGWDICPDLIKIERIGGR